MEGIFAVQEMTKKGLQYRMQRNRDLITSTRSGTTDDLAVRVAGLKTECFILPAAQPVQYAPHGHLHGLRSAKKDLGSILVTQTVFPTN